jgi:hypothetical protein
MSLLRNLNTCEDKEPVENLNTCEDKEPAEKPQHV